MLDVSSLFAGAAWAADAAPDAAQASDVTSSLMRFLPLLLIFAVFYFVLIRPQQKKLDEHAAMIKAIKKGDKVITGGEIAGTVVKLESDEYAMVEIAEGVQVKILRSTITGLAGVKGTDKASTDVKK